MIINNSSILNQFSKTAKTISLSKSFHNQSILKNNLLLSYGHLVDHSIVRDFNYLDSDYLKELESFLKELGEENFINDCENFQRHYVKNKKDIEGNINKLMVLKKKYDEIVNILIEKYIDNLSVGKKYSDGLNWTDKIKNNISVLVGFYRNMVIDFLVNNMDI